jgi:hypothetical protein
MIARVRDVLQQASINPLFFSGFDEYLVANPALERIIPT